MDIPGGFMFGTMSTRWHKVLREVWDHKARTTLVVLSMAAGVFGVGMMASTRLMLLRELNSAYMVITPAHAELQADPFDDDLLKAMRRIPGVVEVEGRTSLAARLLAADKEYVLGLEVVADYEHMRINQVQPLSGDWPPPARQLLLERRSLDFLGLQVGDSVLIEDGAGEQRRMRVAGVVYDLNASLPELSHLISGYITRDTQEWLDGTRQFSRLYLRVADPDSTQTTRRIAEQAAARIERSGGRVNSILVPTPGSHPKGSVLNRVLLLLGILALLTLVLSSFLVTNIISAILTEQVRQIGLMKAIGARSRQLVEMYLGMVLIFALLALLITVPLGAGAAYAFTRMLAYIFNVDVASFSPPPVVLALQVVAGLATPLLATLHPVLKATRVTAYQAINDYGLGQSHFGHGALDRLTMSSRLRGLPRPLLIALRNTFRRKARLALTLLTLTVASTVFVGVFGVRASLVRTFDLALSCWQYDVSVNFNRPERITRLQREALRAPGVLAVEGWNSQPMRRLRADSSLSREMTLIALPAETAMFKPILVEGRWLLPDDDNALVINTDVLKTEPDIKVGDEIQLQFERQRPTRWRVVGVVMGVITGPMLYANQPYYAHLTHTIDHTQEVQVMTGVPAGTGHAQVAERSDADFQMRMAKALETRFEQAGLRVVSTTVSADRRARFMQLLDIFLVILWVASGLLALVGALGLAGSMSINVLERTREIGVMRAIGAGDSAVQQMVLTEGILIGLLSWLSGTLLAWPLGQVVTWLTGTYLLRTPLQYAFSTSGALLWLVVVMLLATLASYLPARSALRLTVREVLAYE
jgi:putative ABC transport system permease protein